MKDSHYSRQALRERLREKRSSISLKEQKETSRKIASHVTSSNVFNSARNIAFYLAVNAEADPSSIQNNTYTPKKQFYLPTLAKDENQGLLFAPANQDSQYTLNRFNIPEPDCSSGELITGEKLDLVIVPLVGFDKSGNRLGMGGGYYDRSFAFTNSLTAPAKPILMGFAYAFQEVDTLKEESWDVRLDYIATDVGLFKCRT